MTPQCQAEAAAEAAAGWSPCPGSPQWKCPWAIPARTCGFHTGWMRGPFFLLYTRWDSQTVVQVPVEINCKHIHEHGLIHLLPALVPGWLGSWSCFRCCHASASTQPSSHSSGANCSEGHASPGNKGDRKYNPVSVYFYMEIRNWRKSSLSFYLQPLSCLKE